MLSDFLNNGYYQYNEFLWIKDEWEDGGDIELLFTKDPNTLTYEDLGIFYLIFVNTKCQNYAKLSNLKYFN